MTGARLTLVLACCGWLSCAGASIVKLNKLPFTGEVRRPSCPLSAAPSALLSPPSPPAPRDDRTRPWRTCPSRTCVARAQWLYEEPMFKSTEDEESYIHLDGAPEAPRTLATSRAPGPKSCPSLPQPPSCARSRRRSARHRQTPRPTSRCWRSTVKHVTKLARRNLAHAVRPFRSQPAATGLAAPAPHRACAEPAPAPRPRLCRGRACAAPRDRALIRRRTLAPRSRPERAGGALLQSDAVQAGQVWRVQGRRGRAHGAPRACCRRRRASTPTACPRPRPVSAGACAVRDPAPRRAQAAYESDPNTFYGKAHFNGSYTARFNPKKWKISRTGLYTVLAAVCEYEVDGTSVDGTLYMKNEYGYIPGASPPARAPAVRTPAEAAAASGTTHAA